MNHIKFIKVTRVEYTVSYGYETQETYETKSYSAWINPSKILLIYPVYEGKYTRIDHGDLGYCDVKESVEEILEAIERLNACSYYDTTT